MRYCFLVSDVIEWLAATFSWNDIPGWFGSIFGFTGFILALRSLKWTKRTTLATEKAAEAAVRSANAAEKSAALSSSMADNHKEIANANHRPDVSWKVEHVAGSRFILRNMGSETATGVTADEAPFGGLARQLPKDAAVRAKEAWEFLLIQVAQAPTPHELWLTWNGQEEQVAVPIPHVGHW